MDGCTLDTQGEKERVIQCIEAAIRRRVSEVTFRFELISLCLFNYCEKKKKNKDGWTSDSKILALNKDFGLVWKFSVTNNTLFYGPIEF